MQKLKLIGAIICFAISIITFFAVIISLFGVESWGLTLAFVTLPLAFICYAFVLLGLILVKPWLKRKEKNHEKKNEKRKKN